MNQVLKAKDVRKAFTNIVNEFISNGYLINYETMSGSQGELAKVDLAKGNGNIIYRVMIDEEVNFCVNCRYYNLIVKKFNVASRSEILWDGKGSEVYSKQYYIINYYRANSAEEYVFVDNEEDMEEIVDKKFDRRESKTIYNCKEIKFDAKALKAIVNKHKGFKSTTLAEIKDARLVRDYDFDKLMYRVILANKNSLVIEL